jgi:aspartate 1-decarboxylase
MLRPSLFAKIHMATVTAAHPDYMGSITIDREILDAIGMRVNDWVVVANCRSGARIETYVFEAPAGSRRIELNGAAAREFEPHDRVIILHFAHMTEDEYRRHRPAVALMGPDNEISEIIHYQPEGPASERE